MDIDSTVQIKDLLKMIKDILPLIIPILLIQWSLMVFALVKLFKSEVEPRFIPRWAWVLVIAFVNLIGPVLYLVIGRQEE